MPQEEAACRHGDGRTITGRRAKKKPWRYRWPDDVHDEVLARLLALNAQRAEEEKLAGKAKSGKRASGERRVASGKKTTKKLDLDNDLLGDLQAEEQK